MTAANNASVVFVIQDSDFNVIGAALTIDDAKAKAERLLARQGHRIEGWAYSEGHWFEDSEVFDSVDITTWPVES